MKGVHYENKITYKTQKLILNSSKNGYGEKVQNTQKI